MNAFLHQRGCSCPPESTAACAEALPVCDCPVAVPGYLNTECCRCYRPIASRMNPVNAERCYVNWPHLRGQQVAS